jgi:hypothetical protein
MNLHGNVSRHPRLRTLRNGVFGVVIAGSMLLAACGGDDPTPTRSANPAPAATVQVGTPTPHAHDVKLHDVQLEMRDFAFGMPSELPAGWVDIYATNNGAVPHQALFGKLNDGVTVEKFNEEMAANPEAVFGLIEFSGGLPETAPGAKSRVRLKLSAGNYIAVDFLAGEDGVPNVAKGMQYAFTVTPSDAPVVDPAADVTVDMHDFYYTMPDEVLAGNFSMKVINAGVQPHEMIIFKLNDGATLDQMFEFIGQMESGEQPAGPPPGEMIGGAFPIGGGSAEVIFLNLEEGNYVGVCFIPDPNSGKSHLELGMVKEFKVVPR